MSVCGLSLTHPKEKHLVNPSTTGSNVLGQPQRRIFKHKQIHVVSCDQVQSRCYLLKLCGARDTSSANTGEKFFWERKAMGGIEMHRR